MSYVSKVLKRFSISDCKLVSHPLANHFKLSSEQSLKTNEEFERMNKIPHTNITVSIMYLMVCTKPDLGHGISILNKFMANPGKTYWIAINGRWDIWTLELRFKFTKCDEGIILKGCTYFNFVDDLNKKRSTTSNIFTLRDWCIIWKFQLQKIVTLSSIEVEYTTTCEVVKGDSDWGVFWRNWFYWWSD